MFLPIPAKDQPGLIADLEGDPFVRHALSSATCELYHRYGMFFAQLTAALTTIKHCQFGHRSPAVINDGGEPRAKPAKTVSTGEPEHSPYERVTEKKVKDPKKGGGRACRRCRQNSSAKTTARTASGSQGIFTSGRRHVSSS